ncbi:MAG: helix-turn-helix domain-containing protein [Acidobacteriota bacterium]
MPRKKFRRSPRFESIEDRSFQEYIFNAPAPSTTRTELIRLIRGGEDTYLELKVKLSNSERVAQGIVALANTDGGTIIFGVNDQLRVEGIANPESVQAELVRICREEVYPPVIPLIDCISFDNGRQVVALEVQGRKKPYRTRDGRFYIRFGSEKREVSRLELSDWLDELRPLAYENIPVPEFGVTDFDDGLLWTFANAFEHEFTSKHNYNTADFLKRDLLLGIGTAEEFTPTLAGVLLFGKNERVREVMPRAKVIATRFAGETPDSEIIERNEINGNLLSVYEESMAFIERNCTVVKAKPGRREAVIRDVEGRPLSRYHLYSLRETVSNALMHRDLAIRDIPTRISVFNHAVEISNARRTGGFIPPSGRAVRYGISQTLNPQIASIFSKREYGTTVPSGGLPMVLRSSMHFSGRRVEVVTSGDEFKVKIFGV